MFCWIALMMTLLLNSKMQCTTYLKTHLICRFCGGFQPKKISQIPTYSVGNMCKPWKQSAHTLPLSALSGAISPPPPPPCSISVWWSYVPYVILLQVQNFFQSWMRSHMCGSSSEGQHTITADPGLSLSLRVNSVLLCFHNALLSLSIHRNNNGNLCRHFVCIANNEKHLQKFPSFSEFSN